MRLSQLTIKLAKHFWSIALSDNEQPEHEQSFQSSDEGGLVIDTVKLDTKTSMELRWSLSIEQVYVFN